MERWVVMVSLPFFEGCVSSFSENRLCCADVRSRYSGLVKLLRGSLFVVVMVCVANEQLW